MASSNDNNRSCKSETHSGIVVIAAAWLIFYCALAGYGLVHSRPARAATGIEQLADAK
jgi:hypothetical protein